MDVLKNHEIMSTGPSVYPRFFYCPPWDPGPAWAPIRDPDKNKALLHSLAKDDQHRTGTEAVIAARSIHEHMPFNILVLVVAPAQYQQ